jgi:hypothetical protein
MEEITNSLANLSLKTESAVRIQKWFRGCMFRLKRLPIVMYVVKEHIAKQSFAFANQTADGRINSCFDEEKVIEILTKEFKDRIQKPNIRMWYDVLIRDYRYGWLPINIKTTTTNTADNTGNLAMAVYAYTNTQLDLTKNYENGKMSRYLVEAIKKGNINKKHKKDYYFLVLNKNNSFDVIVNSVKGLNCLTPNANNLPFQVCWNKNKTYIYKHIKKRIREFVECVQKPNKSWKEEFMTDMRSISASALFKPHANGVRKLQ